MATRVRAGKSGTPDASRLRFGIVVSDYHPEVARRLLEGALECLAAHRVKAGDVPVHRVPGAFEIPQAASRLLQRPDHGFDALICLGLLIRGETLHFEILSREVCRSLAETARQTGVPQSANEDHDDDRPVADGMRNDPHDRAAAIGGVLALQGEF